MRLLLETPHFIAQTDETHLHLSSAKDACAAATLPLDEVSLNLLGDVVTKALALAPKAQHLGRLALQIAHQEMALGAGEQGENNQGPFVRKYINDLCELPANWCAGFVSWCFREASRRLKRDFPPFPYLVGARAIFNHGVKEGWEVQDMEKRSLPGDIVVWWRDDPRGWTGHVGILVDYDPGRRLYRVIEGNRGSFPSCVRIYDYNYQMLRSPDKSMGLLGVVRVPG